MIYNVDVVLTKDEYGYHTYCPELPGCHSQGDSLEEAKSNIKEAVKLYMETMSKEEIKTSLNIN